MTGNCRLLVLETTSLPTIRQPSPNFTEILVNIKPLQWFKSIFTGEEFFRGLAFRETRLLSLFPSRTDITFCGRNFEGEGNFELFIKLTPVWPDVGIKSRPNFHKVAPKVATTAFYINNGVFKVALKVIQYFVYFLKNFLPITFKNHPIWSPPIPPPASPVCNLRPPFQRSF